MIVHVGGYSFPDNECFFETHTRSVLSRRGQRLKLIQDWVVRGSRKAATKSALTAALAEMEQALLQDGQDLRFTDSDGTATQHNLLSNSTTNGTRLMSLRYLGGIQQGMSGVEYVSQRSYEFVIRGEILLPQDDIVDFAESVTVIGTGGPVSLWMESLTGLPQQQILRAHSKFTTIREGYLVGLTGYPAYPSFEPTGFINPELFRTRRGEARVPGLNQSTEWPIFWRVVYESASLLGI